MGAWKKKQWRVIHKFDLNQAMVTDIVYYIYMCTVAYLHFGAYLTLYTL